jgi:subtilisin
MNVRFLTALLALPFLCTIPLHAGAQPGPPQGSYIVVLNAGVGMPEDVALDLALKTNGRIGYVYENVLQGFSITMPSAALAGIERDPRVAYVEADLPVSIFAQTVPTGIQRIFADTNSSIGIDGIDNRVDADVGVLDTGIDREHPDLNVFGGANCLKSTGGGPPWSRTYYCDANESGDDDHYHGTHVAGTIGAIDNDIGVVGVAPGVRLWAVKVLDAQGSGSLSGIIAGIDWFVVQNIKKPAVINMSLGGSGTSTAMNDSIANAVKEQNVAVVVAAGNSDADAANYTPANAPDAITVSALADFNGEPGGGAPYTCRNDQDDTLADFSNWGSTIDIAAPGVCILSTYPIERGSYGTISGTSMAAPHVAGAAALLASTLVTTNDPNKPATIRETLLDTGNFEWTDDSGDKTKEPLLDVSDPIVFQPVFVDGGGSGDANTSPVASFTVSCSDLTCTFTDTSTDSDGDILDWAWNFGDGATSTAQNPMHTYAADGSYLVSLMVTDDDGAKDQSSETVTVAGPSADDFALSATGYKVRGLQKADLTWSGANSTDVDVFCNTVKIDTTANNGAYTDNIDLKGGGSYTYKVCEADTNTCSNEVLVAF